MKRKRTPPLDNPEIYANVAREDAEQYRDHLAAVGRVAVSFSALEFSIDYRLATLANIGQDIGACFTTQMIGPNPRLNALVALSRYRGISKRLESRLVALASKVRGLGEERNRAIHDMWFRLTPDKAYRFERTARQKLVQFTKHISASELEDLADRIEVVASELMSAFRKHAEELVQKDK